MQQFIADEGEHIPLAVSSLKQGRYIDDIFGGADSIPEAKFKIDQLIQLCKAGGFPLQKWNSNSLELLEHLLVILNDNASSVEIESSRIKVLGLNWQPGNNDF